MYRVPVQNLLWILNVLNLKNIQISAVRGQFELNQQEIILQFPSVAQSLQRLMKKND